MEQVKKIFWKRQTEPKVQKYFDWAIKLLSFTGYEFNHSGSDTSDRTKIAFFWFVVVNLVLAITSSGAMIFTVPIDWDQVTFGLPVVASSLMIILKAIVIFANKSKVLEILKMARQLEDSQELKSADNLKMFRKFVAAYTFSLASPMAVNITSPVIKFLFTGERTFTLGMKFPFDATNKFIYPFVLLWTTWNLINGFLIFISTDILVFGCIRIISTDFEILKDKFAESNIDNFRELIVHHNVLFDVCKKLNRIFSTSFFYKFIISSFVICFTAFQCSTSSDVTKIVINMTICIANFNQIGLQCFYGQMLKSSSESVADSIYSCNWESSAHSNTKKSVIVCIARAQRYVALTSLNFSEISFNQFTYVSYLWNLGI